MQFILSTKRMSLTECWAQHDSCLEHLNIWTAWPESDATCHKHDEYAHHLRQVISITRLRDLTDWSQLIKFAHSLSVGPTVHHLYSASATDYSWVNRELLSHQHILLTSKSGHCLAMCTLWHKGTAALSGLAYVAQTSSWYRSTLACQYYSVWADLRLLLQHDQAGESVS